jgi:hypothetical protein
MAMMPQLFTLNGLSAELGRDFRLIARRLRGVPPDGKVGKRPAWFLRTAIAAMQAHDEEKRGARRGNSHDLPELPRGIRTDDPLAALVGMVAGLALSEISDVVARLVIGAGGDADTAYFAASFAPEVMRRRLGEVFARAGLDRRALPDTAGMATVDWSAIAKQTGQRFDEAVMKAACRERLARQPVEGHPAA